VAGELRVRSPYVEVLEAQRADLITALRPHVSDDLIASAQRLSARLSVRLDASPLDDATADTVDRELLHGPDEGEGERQRAGGRGSEGEGERQRAGGRGSQGEGERQTVAVPPDGGGFGWARALKLDSMPTQEIAAVEYRRVRAALGEEAGLARTFFADPLSTLVRVHAHVAGGLVSEDRLGALRRTSRAVTDGAQGMVIFHAPEPQRLPVLLDGLDGWLRSARDRHTPLVIAGVVHLRLLAWHPFEAGNGRVARVASRVALRAAGGDPWGLAVPELIYVRDPLRYVTEVAATIRRRSDLTPWIERAGEAVVASLEACARKLGVESPSVSARGAHECERLEVGEQITAPQYATATECDRPTAMVEMNRLCWLGLLERDPGTHGLRYVRRQPDGVR
jgi:hypothetical protein